MKDYFMISEVDGSLYDTRIPEWSKLAPLRENYRIQREQIRDVANLKAALRAGSVTWPGCYPLYFITDDGAVLSFGTVRAEFRLVADSVANNSSDGWRVVACAVNHEDSELRCEHSGDSIPYAYGD